MPNSYSNEATRLIGPDVDDDDEPRDRLRAAMRSLGVDLVRLLREAGLRQATGNVDDAVVNALARGFLA